MTCRWRTSQLCAFAFCMSFAVGCSRAPNTLTCKSGTRHGDSSFRDGRVEFCVDAGTGRREGPERHWSLEGRLVMEVVNRNGKPNGVARSYGPDGSLYSEDTFEDGEIKSVRFTLPGIKDQIAQLNATLRAKGDAKGLFRVIDEHTLEYQVQIDGPTARLMATASEELSNRSWNSEQMKDLRRRGPCRMFASGVRTVIYRYVDESGRNVSTRAVTAADCL
jgi:hypothetical protein